MRTIETNGADIHVVERPRGGYAIQQGHSHLLVTEGEAATLAQVLDEMVRTPRVVTPAKARFGEIVRFSH
jgi:hypothetical protein